MMRWQERLEFMHAVADAYPHEQGREVAMYRRGKRGPGMLRQP
jgi:hypothetical protein